ncbi:MAG: class I SAM-dependent methyltransferase [Nanoarchaeota archaeon]
MTYYDDIAAGYEELHRTEQMRKIEICMRYIMPKKEEKLLDVGCGSGISTEVWECERHGIDPSQELILVADEHRNGPEYKVGKVEELPYEDEFFDYVISVTAIQNFDDLKKGLSEMHRVLKKGGKVIISTLKDSPQIKEIEQAIMETFTIDEMVDDVIDVFFIGRRI